MKEILVEKNEEDELPIPHIWRAKFRQIVSSFVEKDYKISEKIDLVNTVSGDTAQQIQEYIKDYGEVIVELLEETWNTSVYMWYEGYWNVYVDLFTESEGLSDLVLNVEVRERDDQYEFEIKLVFVP
ncbi:hypothetical protein [Flammeovirga sp. SJP92]|uniref:DUF7668 domain-containing protein n=1 Tax=Flammeovirga sp. SJP92 TaxID=1775430 RepID=UPI0007897066|nr:hypothetical protein [Flammeovirga sp. SJP92]KXX69800.1 hypothetical protein AVL50_12995 [Flammeovirga sp. SJP92]